MEAPLITDDAVVFGILMAILGFVFYTSSKEAGFWKRFYTFIPALLMCYLLPSILATAGVIGVRWEEVNEAGELISGKTELYNMAKLYLLPTALVLMTLSIGLKRNRQPGSEEFGYVPHRYGWNCFGWPSSDTHRFSLLTRNCWWCWSGGGLERFGNACRKLDWRWCKPGCHAGDLRLQPREIRGHGFGRHCGGQTFGWPSCFTESDVRLPSTVG